MNRYVKRLTEIETRERWRLGMAVAVLAGCWTKKKDGSMVQPWDVFSDLRASRDGSDDGARTRAEPSAAEHAQQVNRMFQNLAKQYNPRLERMAAARTAGGR